MRVTMKSIHYDTLVNLNKMNTDMARLNNKISSGKEMATISDDPVSMVVSLGLKTGLSQIGSYKNNLNFGDKLIAASENALTQMNNLVMRAKTIAIQQTNASTNARNRLDTAGEIRHLWDEAITLANTEINGKYIFGGYRTSGYSDSEPEPFIADLGSGYRINGQDIAAMNGQLTASMPAGDIAVGDLTVNSTATTLAITDDAGQVAGLYMGKAVEAKAAIEAADPAVSVSLTTLYAGAASTPEGGNGGETITQSINGISFSVVVPNGATANDIATLTVAAINGIADQSRVAARVGNGSNGGVADSVVLYNASPGDETDIVVGAQVNANADTGLTAGTYSPDATHNTGAISLSSANAFTLASPNHADDTILTRLSLGGGNKGFADLTGDGTVRYGSALAADELRINGAAIAATVSDGLSTVYADASAAAKAKAINDLAETTGVSAGITPASQDASGAVAAGTIDSGDLVINGQDIFAGATAISAEDSDNALIDAINAKSALSGVVATRNSVGALTLNAVDGRNIQITTTANGETISSLNGGAGAANKVYFGSVHLYADQPFTLETTPVGATEPGLDALGLGGGSTFTGESADTDGDGELRVISIQKKDGNVRYAGDSENSLAIKVGKLSIMEVGKNGKEAVVDTGIFSMLKKLEENLRGEKFTSVTGLIAATDTAAQLDSGNTGLEQQDKTFTSGSIQITVTDHLGYPPSMRTSTIAVNPAEDSPADIASRIDGIQGIGASWNSDGQLALSSDDPERYTFSFTDDSNFMDLAGASLDIMQVQALEQSIAETDTVMGNITAQISDFGAKANRIEVQRQIYSNLELSVTTNLSEEEDTDMVKALMELKNKELAYKATLTSAARVMQLSLVDFLR